MNRIIPPRYQYAGVYMLKNETNGKVYIGSSANIENRLNTHRSDLRRGKHYCKALQEDFDQHHKITAHILYVEVIPQSSKQINRRKYYAIEHKFIKEYDAFNNGYNTMPISEITRNFNYG